ncbi:hypothetical protein [Cryptosporangium arvum]|uniref:Uncharacterized protein n=1 Tax=Cryptosporangium arvum DSM 44712 TaxID=927661 RepID=A0A010YJW5_9ACTN|nr:hypothetical protein [Cryptosporangium arvum]EXG80540.1 hypothetical protein CryarDRAFT_1620 [Cryptosporangium arvum DSM 44712]
MTSPLEDHLAAGMREVAAGYHVDRDLIAGARTAQRRRTRHRRAVVSAAAVAVLAIGGAGYALAEPGGSSTDRLTSAAPPLDRTLRTKGPYILHITTYSDGEQGEQKTEIWRDPVTDDQVEIDGGGPGIDIGYNMRTSMTAICVDRNERTWWSCRPEQNSIPLATPENMRAWLKTETTLRAVGRETINGVDTVHLAKPRTAGRAFDVWVTADTDVLVRQRSSGEYEPGSGVVTIQTDYEWFDRTPEARARVTLSPPSDWPSRPPR